MSDNLNYFRNLIAPEHAHTLSLFSFLSFFLSLTFCHSISLWEKVVKKCKHQTGREQRRNKTGKGCYCRRFLSLSLSLLSQTCSFTQPSNLLSWQTFIDLQTIVPFNSIISTMDLFAQSSFENCSFHLHS